MSFITGINQPLLCPTVSIHNLKINCKLGVLTHKPSGKKMLADYSESYPELAQKFNDAVVGKITTDFSFLPQFEDGDSKATRATGSEILQSMADNIPTIWGGSADLFSSNKTQINDSDRFSKDNPTGRNLWFGVREFGEATAVNGIALHGGTRVYGSTFMAFSDYMRGALRLAAIQHLPVTYVFTHDSIAVGEDGPTHEPVEQLVSLQAIPDLQVIRPADANEVVEAWKVALSATDHPTVIILTRQGVPALSGARTNPDGLKHGGYVISPQQGEKPEAIIMLVVLKLVWQLKVNTVCLKKEKMCRWSQCQALKRLMDNLRNIRKRYYQVMFANVFQ